MSDLENLYNFKHLVKLRTSIKNPDHSSYIDLFLTDRPGCFQDNRVFQTGISDFYKLVVKVLRTRFKKQKPQTVKRRNYEKFNI